METLSVVCQPYWSHGKMSHRSKTSATPSCRFANPYSILPYSVFLFCQPPGHPVQKIIGNANHVTIFAGDKRSGLGHMGPMDLENVTLSKMGERFQSRHPHQPPDFFPWRQHSDVHYLYEHNFFTLFPSRNYYNNQQLHIKRIKITQNLYNNFYVFRHLDTIFRKWNLQSCTSTNTNLVLHWQKC